MLVEQGEKLAAEITQANGAAMFRRLDMTSEGGMAGGDGRDRRR